MTLKALGIIKKPKAHCCGRLFFVQGHKERGHPAWSLVAGKKQSRKLPAFLEAVDAVAAAVGETPKTFREFHSKAWFVSFLSEKC